jgi:hypothetical protein
VPRAPLAVPASGRAGFARTSVCDPEPKPAELSDPRDPMPPLAVPASGRAGFARTSVCDPEPKPAELSDPRDPMPPLAVPASGRAGFARTSVCDPGPQPAELSDPRSRGHRLRCPLQDVRALPVRPSAIPGPSLPSSPTHATEGTACGARFRTCGLCPYVRLRSRAQACRALRPTRPRAPLAVPVSGRAGFARTSVCDPEPKPAELSDPRDPMPPLAVPASGRSGFARTSVCDPEPRACRAI